MSFIQKSIKIQEKKIYPSIELLRIIGSFCVIDIHIKLNFKSFKNFPKIFLLVYVPMV